MHTPQDINLGVHRGDIYGFLSPNGSGKATTLSPMLDLKKLQQGTINMFGMSLLPLVSMMP